MVKGVKSELHSLFLNIISNALKFVEKDTVPKVKIKYQNKTDFHIISVIDNGIGISKKNTEQIFEVFKRLHNTNEYKGTGIGLAHCKKIIEQTGGKITLDSKVGQGSTFNVFFKKALKND